MVLVLEDQALPAGLRSSARATAEALGGAKVLGGAGEVRVLGGALGQAGERLAVAGQHELGFEAADQPQRVQVVGQRIAGGANVQPDGRGGYG